MHDAAVLCLDVDQEDEQSMAMEIDRLLLSVHSGPGRNDTHCAYRCVDYSLDISMHPGQHAGPRAWLMPSHDLCVQCEQIRQNATRCCKLLPWIVWIHSVVSPSVFGRTRFISVLLEEGAGWAP
jgi:hypothetical protein